MALRRRPGNVNLGVFVAALTTSINYRHPGVSRLTSECRLATHGDGFNLSVGVFVRAVRSPSSNTGRRSCCAHGKARWRQMPDYGAFLNSLVRRSTATVGND